MTEGKESLHGQKETDKALIHIRASLRGLRYGVVTIIVQDGVIVQIERTEKTRLHRHG